MIMAFPRIARLFYAARFYALGFAKGVTLNRAWHAAGLFVDVFKRGGRAYAMVGRRVDVVETT